jgi:UDP-GlcNAc:undecaprenyl-phosphate GlcNAc-1-phosphate transferase
VVGAGVLAGLVLSLVWSGTATRFGPSLGFVDRPDDPSLKVHRQAAVPLGGVGILAGVWAGWWLAGGQDPRVMVLAAALTMLGLVDDRIGLSARVRLLAQALIAVLTVGWGAASLERGRWVDVAVGVVLIVVSINAVNLFDGLDGLAGSAGAVAALGLGALAVARGTDPNLPWVLAASIGGFLILNRHPARVFLGDNGAYLIGFLLAVGVLRVSPDGLGLELVVAVLMLGVFLVDLAFTSLRRGLNRQPLFVGDRSHAYDRLTDRGWPVGRVVMAAVLAQIGVVALALLIEAVLVR